MPPPASPTSSRRERLQKLLAAAGVASRRRAEDLLRAGRVTVNGAVARLGDSADPQRDRIALDGAPLHREPLAYWMVHKPRGVLTTAHDPFGRPTVLELVPEPEARVFPVGRLDRDSEGLVLLTNDGALAQALLHPSHGHEREYLVTVRGRVPARSLRQLARGIALEDGLTAPAGVAQPRYDAKTGRTTLRLTLIEGRKRQIRRALGALGHPVVGLVRVRLGPLRLGRLAPGGARRLSQRERSALQRLAEPADPLRLPAPSPRAGSGFRATARDRTALVAT